MRNARRPDAATVTASRGAPYDPVASLVVDLLEWIGAGSRPYADVIGAWKTSCPRLPVWEEANRLGYVVQRHAPGRGADVLLSPAGLAHLEAARARR